jgi:hypothetical protein
MQFTALTVEQADRLQLSGNELAAFNDNLPELNAIWESAAHEGADLESLRSSVDAEALAAARKVFGQKGE